MCVALLRAERAPSADADLLPRAAVVDPSVRYPPEWWNGTQGGPVTLSKVPVAETWSAMEAALEAGKAKEIGVSNFNGSLLIDLIRGAKHAPTVLQIEHHRAYRNLELPTQNADPPLSVQPTSPRSR